MSLFYAAASDCSGRRQPTTSGIRTCPDTSGLRCPREVSLALHHTACDALPADVAAEYGRHRAALERSAKALHRLESRDADDALQRRKVALRREPQRQAATVAPSPAGAQASSSGCEVSVTGPGYFPTGAPVVDYFGLERPLLPYPEDPTETPTASAGGAAVMPPPPPLSIGVAQAVSVQAYLRGKYGDSMLWRDGPDSTQPTGAAPVAPDLAVDRLQLSRPPQRRLRGQSASQLAEILIARSMHESQLAAEEASAKSTAQSSPRFSTASM